MPVLIESSGIELKILKARHIIEVAGGKFFISLSAIKGRYLISS
ncbi:hypothetical protein [Legionella moravica]|uniref:Uncharacterized protein n=1 Tax=Legionella moravica TaxID=39962 RepID=A0A378JWW0_9GAMM|nr:hypothetical protein [Legionella moravica]STX63143.1 Uncharacterised protein [Legionella moravica]